MQACIYRVGPKQLTEIHGNTQQVATIDKVVLDTSMLAYLATRRVLAA